MDKPSIQKFFDAESYAIIGASTKLGSPGYVLADLFSKGYKGKLFMINPRGGEVMGHQLYTSLKEVPQQVEAAVIIVPAKYGVQAVRDCIDAGIRFITVISGGFAEVSEEGRKWQEEIKAMAEEVNARIVGPNCVGIYDPTTGVDMVFLPADKLKRPKTGPISVLTQSGALGAAIMNEVMNLHGEDWIAHMISFGNAVDVNEHDALQFFSTDEATKVIWAYIEGLRDAPETMRLIRNVSNEKPVITIKANRTSAGAHASSSHSASLAMDDAVFDYLLEQAGSIRADNWEEMFDIGRAVLSQPLPKGRNVAIVTDGGGMGVMCSDSVDKYGLKLATFSDAMRAKFKETMPPYYISGNPIDLTGSASSKDFAKAMRLAVDDENVEGVILILLPCVPNVDVREYVELIGSEFGMKDGVDNRPSKPIISVVMGGTENDVVFDGMEGYGIPTYRSEDAAVKVLRQMVRYAEFKDREQEIAKLGLTHKKSGRNDTVDAIIAKARAERRAVLLESEAREILAATGMVLPEGTFVKTPEEAVAFQEKVGKPIAMKLVSPEVIHKTDEGAVLIGLKTKEDVESSARHLLEKFANRDARGLLCVEMVDKGTELMIGVNYDATFGQIVVAGLGGIFVEVLKDVSFNLCPTHQYDADKMLENLEHQEMLNGFRGAPVVDRKSFVSMIVTISELADAYKDEIKEMDLNPIIAAANGNWAVDARIILHEK